MRFCDKREGLKDLKGIRGIRHGKSVDQIRDFINLRIV